MPTTATPDTNPSAREDVLAALQTFGHSEFRPGQEATIHALLAGRSALAIFPTGGGKSLCYQLPALLLDGLTLVISPLIALMKDQVDVLRARGIAAARLDTSLESSEYMKVIDDMVSGRLKLLYVAPERLANEGFVRRLQRTKIALMAIDEAHCISEWGHNFRPDYLKLARFANAHAERVLALTATATPSVAADVCKAFAIEPADHVQTGFYRPNLTLRVTPCAGHDRRALLLERLREQSGPTIVYVTLQKTAERVAEFLQSGGVDAQAYHAGMKSEQRAAIQDAFMSGASRVVVATIAFGMGIDKADIRAVYHYNLPKTLENYVQEVGRAGRDGEPSHCEVLGCADDAVVLSNFTYGDTPSQRTVRDLVDDLFGRDEQFSVSRYHLARNHDVRDLVVATLLTYLELDGHLRSTGPFYSGYKFELHQPRNEVIGRFDPARQGFLNAVFDACKFGKKWYTIEPAEVALALNEPRERILAALGYLEQTGALSLRPSGLRHGYARVGRPDLEALSADLAGRFLERERRDVERLEQFLAFAEEPGCLSRCLMAYFGEELPGDCGHCSRCLGDAARPLPRRAPQQIGAAERALVQGVIDEGRPALARPRALARFLCGLVSPATSRDKLRSHPRWASLEPVPFPEVLKAVRELMGTPEHSAE